MENHASKRVIQEPYSDRSLSTSGHDMTEEVLGVATDRSSVVIGITERSDAVIRGLKFILEHHNASKRVLCDLEKQLHDYLDTSSAEGIWLKRMKYVLTYPLAKYLRNEKPASPDVLFAPSGNLRRWMKARLNAFNRKNTHLWYSWLQAKRCALSVSDTMVAEAYEKHFSQLSKPDPCLPGGAGHAMLERAFGNPTFRAVLTHIRNNLTKSYQNDFTDWTPSTSACFEESRSRGGQFGALDQISFEHRNGVPPQTEEKPCPNSPFFDVIESVTDDYLRTGIPEKPVLFYSAASALEDLKDDIDDGSTVRSSEGTTLREYCEMTYRMSHIGGDELVSMYQLTTVRGGNPSFGVVEQFERPGRYRWKMLGEAKYSVFEKKVKCNATIQAVLEPLKIRIISKGSALAYYSMKPLQKRIHSVMRELSCFRLIGRPICPTDLIDLIPKGEISDDDNWISVDYSAATDGLSSSFGLRILQFLIRDLPFDDQIIADCVLGKHDLYYPEFKNGKWGGAVLRGEQQNGQLMGGILSFPILCLANLAVYCLVKDLQATRWADVKQLMDQVLVNGDDMLYVGNQKNWDDHIEISGKVGLEMSVGKAYMHRAYANANSTSFICDLGKIVGNPVPWQINYLNAGLVFGQHKVQAREYGTAESHHTDSTSVVANIPTILDGCLPGTQSKMLEHVLKLRTKDIKADTLCTLIGAKGKRTSMYRNLFLPVQLGGMGLNSPVGWKYHIKKIDRRLAKSTWDPQLDVRPLRGYELEKEIEKVPPWIRKVAEPSQPEFRLRQGRLRQVPVGAHTSWWCNRSARLC